jgi:hypothetical protein
MGRGKDVKGGKNVRGKEKKFREEEEDEDEEEEEEEEVVQKGRAVGGQSATAGMMPPDDDDDEDEEEEDDDDDDPPPSAKEMADFIKSKGLGNEFMAWLKKKRAQPTAAKVRAPHPGAIGRARCTCRGARASAATNEPCVLAVLHSTQAPAGYEMSRKEREAKKRQEEEEEESDDEPDPAIAARLEAVRKRREAQAAQRVATDGWDRYATLSATNHPPDTTWPPPNSAGDKEAEAEARVEAKAPPPAEKPADPAPAKPVDKDEEELDLSTKKKKKKKPVDLS